MTAKPIPHGTVAGYNTHRCRCIPCSDASAAWQRRRYRRMGAGVWRPFIDPARALAHVEALHAQGMAYVQIGRAAGISWNNFSLLLGPVGQKKQIKRIRQATEDRILAVKFNVDQLPAKALIPARGAVRRIHALRAQGWPLYLVAERAGLGSHTVKDLQRQNLVHAETFRRVATVYDDLRDLDPAAHGVDRWVVRRAVRGARADRMAPPSAWVDIDTDDQPAPWKTWKVRYAKAHPGDRSAAVLEDTAYLAEFGLTREQIAERLGVSWEAVHRVHLRAGQPLPLPLRQEVAA